MTTRYVIELRKSWEPTEDVRESVVHLALEDASRDLETTHRRGAVCFSLTIPELRSHLYGGWPDRLTDADLRKLLRDLQRGGIITIARTRA